MNKNISDYIQNQIIKYCWYHQYYKNEIGYNGKLIIWKQWLLLVSKRWFHYITSVLNDKYIINKSYEFISNFQNKYSINQIPPTYLEITSNMYIKLLNYLNDDQSKYLFFSNLQHLKFIFDSGYNNFMNIESIPANDYNYLFGNIKNIIDIKIKFYGADGLSRKCLNTSNILDSYINLINKDYILFKNQYQQQNISEFEVQLKYNNSLSLKKLNLHFNGLDIKFLRAFKNLKLYSLKKLKLNYYYYQDNYINEIIDSLHEINQLDGLYITFYSSVPFDEMDSILKRLYNSNTNNKLLKELKEFKVNIYSRTNTDENDHIVYNTLVQLLKEMKNLNHLILFCSKFEYYCKNSQELLSLSRVKLIQYLLCENSTIKKLDTDLFDSDKLSSLSSLFNNCKQFKLISTDSNYNLDNLLPLYSNDSFRVIMTVAPPSISISFLKHLKIKHLTFNLCGQPQKNNNCQVINEIFSSIVKNNNSLECLDIVVSNYSNLKCYVSEKVIREAIESIDKSSSLKYLSISMNCLENSKQIINKVNELQSNTGKSKDNNNNHNKLVWLESSIIAYPGKTTVNRNLKLIIIKK